MKQLRILLISVVLSLTMLTQGFCCWVRDIPPQPEPFLYAKLLKGSGEMQFTIEANSGEQAILTNNLVLSNDISNSEITEEADHWSIKLETEQEYKFSAVGTDGDFCVQFGTHPDYFTVRPEMVWGFAKFQMSTDITLSIYLGEYDYCKQAVLSGEGDYVIGLLVVPIAGRPESYGIISGKNELGQILIRRAEQMGNYTLQNMNMVDVSLYYCEVWTDELVSVLAEQKDLTGRIVLFGNLVNVFQNYLPFADVFEKDWYYGAVIYAENNRWMNGYPDGNFGPQNLLTRADFVTLLHRLAGLVDAGIANFTDISPDAYYAAAVAWAAENGIVNGTSETEFSPNASLTREQLMTVLYRYTGAEAQGTGAESFADYDSVSDYAKAAMNWAIESGIITGKDGLLVPQGAVTRAEAAVVSYRYLN